MIFNNFNEYMIFVEHTSQNNVFYSVLIAEHKWSPRSPIKVSGLHRTLLDFIYYIFRY